MRGISKGSAVNKRKRGITASALCAAGKRGVKAGKRISFVDETCTFVDENRTLVEENCSWAAVGISL